MLNKLFELILVTVISDFIRELGAAERIYCREQTDYGNQTLVQVLIISNTNKINETKARQALIKLYRDHCPVLGYKISSSTDRTTLVYQSKDRQHAEKDLMSNLKYEEVNIRTRPAQLIFAVAAQSCYSENELSWSGPSKYQIILEKKKEL